MLKYESADNYKQYFENCLIIHEDKFHCYLCNFTCQFLFWHDILVHIKDKQHNILKSLVPSMSDICSHYLNALEEYASIVSNCVIYLYIPGIFYCYICNTNIPDCMINLNEHIKGKRHNKQKLTFKIETCERYIALENCLLKIPKDLYWVIRTHNIHIFQDKLYCELCNVNMSNDSAVDSHLRKHRRLKNIYQRYLDIKSKKVTHTAPKAILSTYNSSDTGDVINNTKCELLSNIPKYLKWIITAIKIQIFPDKLYCKLCDVKMTNNKQVQSHLITHYIGYEMIQKNNKNEKDMNTSINIISKMNEFVNVKCQDEPADTDIEVSEKTTIKRLNNFNTESIFSVPEEITSSVYLSLFKENEIIYCLICQKDISNKFQEYYDHIFSTEHLVDLNKTIHIKRVCSNLSKLFLAKNGIKDNTDEFFLCMLCNNNIRSNEALNEHIYNTRDHQLRYDQWMKACLKFYDKIWTSIKNNWYYVNKYRCNICSKEFSSEIYFAQHINKQKDIHDLDSYNFHSCVPCGLLWYDYNLLYSAHSKTVEHKYMVSFGNNIINKFPNEVGQLLLSCEENAETLLHFSNNVSLMVIQADVLTILKNYMLLTFYGVEVYIYGSRLCGLGLPDNDTNIFLNCSNLRDGKKISSTKHLIEAVKRTLLLKPSIWEVQTTIQILETQILKVQYKPRKLYCSISFNNKIAVESTNLIRRFSEVYPPCRKLILILKKWLSFCGISGLPYISNYALTWCVIFYLQQMLILPSVTELIQANNKSKLIDGWQVGVSYDFRARKNVQLSFKKLLAGFFMFFADFDYRCKVICPLLGKEIEKTAFTNLSLLPKEMAPYIEYVTNNKSTMFCLSPMSVQDPFILSDNLTAMIQKNTLNNFRIFCSKSVEILMNTF